MRIALLLLVPLLLFTAWQHSRRTENEHRLALVASEVALRDVEVSCPGFWTRLVEVTPYAGWVAFDEHGAPSDRANLSAATCKGLERVWRGEQRSFDCLLAGDCAADALAAVSSLVTLAHESWHLRGVVVEAETQCYAVQTVEAFARRLGVSPRDARLLAFGVARDNALRATGEYHSPHCRPGGAFDLRPATAAWPSG